MRVLAALALAVTIPNPAVAQSAAPRLTGFPDSFVWQNEPADWKLDQGALTITAGKKTDWFAWPGGGSTRDEAPRLLFKTADDFVISAKVTTHAPAIYDAGCLALYGTATSWAKFCLEALGDGRLAIISVVTRDLSDDVTSFPVEGRSTYLKLAKLDRVIMLYASNDGRRWTIVRKFNLETSSGFLAGFSAQSPNGEGATAIFEEFSYRPERIDIWKLN